MGAFLMIDCFEVMMIDCVEVMMILIHLIVRGFVC